jgi:hypothetical protein
MEDLLAGNTVKSIWFLCVFTFFLIKIADFIIFCYILLGEQLEQLVSCLTEKRKERKERRD